MNITFLYLPSFDQGFGIEIVDRTEKKIDPENWKPSSLSISETKIEKADYSVVQNLSEISIDSLDFETSTNFSLSDSLCKELSNLLQNVSLTLTASNFSTADGKEISFTFSDLNNELTLKYNSQPPSQWNGVAELQTFFENLPKQQG